MMERMVEKEPAEAALSLQKRTEYYGGDAFRYAELLKIDVWYRDIGKVPAFFKSICRIPYIVLNEKLDFENPALINTIVAHEIGHFVLNHENVSFESKFGRFDADYEEGEANKFAAALLMETEAFIDTIKFNENINETAREFNVLPFLVVFKLKELRKQGFKTPNVSLETFNSALKLFRCG